MNLWDLGGQTELRYIWINYLKECHAVIFVVDSADSQRFIEAIACLGFNFRIQYIFDNFRTDFVSRKH